MLSINTISPASKGKQRLIDLWQLQDKLLSHVRSLEGIGVKGETYGLFLTPLILSRLPQDIRLEWAREGEGEESNLQFLLKFLRREIQRRERSETFRDNTFGYPSAEAEEKTSVKKRPSQPQGSEKLYIL